MLPKTELESFVEAAFGEIDLESAIADVDAKREETDALGLRYGRVAIEDATDCGSVLVRATGGRTVGAIDGPGGSKGESLWGGVMESGEFSEGPTQRDCFRRSPAVAIPSTMRVGVKEGLRLSQELMMDSICS